MNIGDAPVTERRTALRERINELRAKQRGHSLQEEECALRIQFHIKRQSELEDDIIAIEIERNKL